LGLDTIETVATRPLDGRPRLRGVFHQYAFFASLVSGVVVILAAEGPAARAVTAVYALAVSGLFGVSAVYHRVFWTEGARRRMRRLDHSMIFVLIAGTYTPIAALAIESTLGTTVLIVAWAGAAAGIVLKVVWIDAPNWIAAILYLGLGWVMALAIPAVAHSLGAAGAGLVILGGLLYSIGAVIYAVRRPNPRPATFGYHEIFHVLVIAAAACHYAAVLFFVLPNA
jgi:hemolysin III